MKYTIKIDYTTGDSERSTRKTDFLECQWKNISIAKENLRRIKEHHDYYVWDEYNRRGWKADKTEPTRPEFWDAKCPWNIILLVDNGNEWKMSAFWTGMFETIHMAEIVAVDDEMKVEFD